MNLPIKISENAFAEVKNIVRNKGIDVNMGLRIGVKGSGCSGNSFYLGFDNSKDTDGVFNIDNVKIFIEKKHFLYLVGMKLDFVDNDTQRGFTFVTEN
ncbi:MAG: HesB/IscA family protein [Cytophagales bacterium]